MNRRDALAGLALGTCGLAAVGARKACANLISSGADGVQGQADDVVQKLIDVRQAQRFTDAPVPDADVQRIVTAGLNAPSALNLQPWFFTVVTDRELLLDIDKTAKVDPKGRLSVGGSPLVIFVSVNDSDYGKYDSGAAADRMNVVANLLGYGCKTVATAAKAANDEKYRERLHIPEGYQIFAALLIGKEIEPSVDGVSGATSREPREKKIFFVK